MNWSRIIMLAHFCGFVAQNQLHFDGKLGLYRVNHIEWLQLGVEMGHHLHDISVQQSPSFIAVGWPIQNSPEV
jgi:hypothetical protein